MSSRYERYQDAEGIRRAWYVARHTAKAVIPEPNNAMREALSPVFGRHYARALALTGEVQLAVRAALGAIGIDPLLSEGKNTAMLEFNFDGDRMGVTWSATDWWLWIYSKPAGDWGYVSGGEWNGDEYPF